MSTPPPVAQRKSETGPIRKAALLDGQLAAMLRHDRPVRLLLLSASTDKPGMPELPAGGWVELRPGQPGGPVRCAWEALPFADDIFDVVVLFGVLSNGREAELQEAIRVLRPGGILLISGRGHFQRARGLPYLSVGKLCRCLDEQDFDVRSCDIIGLFGSNTVTARRWLRPIAGWSHAVLLRARHHDDTPALTPLRFGAPRAAGVRTALDSVSREAV